MKQVIFFHGAGDEGYEADHKLADSLRDSLGEDYTIHYPHLITNESAADFEWPRQIGRAVATVSDPILIGHSLGASMLLKYLTEHQVHQMIAGIFLLATPFWSGDEKWKQGLILSEDFADHLPALVPIYFYHCRDDEEVPVSQLERYKQYVSEAFFRTPAKGGHQFGNDLTVVANDIKGL